MNFYRLTTSEKFQNAEWSSENDTESITCPIDKGHQRSGARKGDLIIKLPYRIGHVVETWYSEILITDHVKHLFEEAGFKGYELKPVIISEVERKHKKILQLDNIQSIPILWEMIITGWGGMALLESGVKLLESESCNTCGYLVYSDFTDPSKLIDLSQWDGSDFFIVWPLPRFIFVHEKVVKLIKNHKLKGFKFIPLNKLSSKDNLLGMLIPGRLSRWMPEERAHLLGDPLNIF